MLKFIFAATLALVGLTCTASAQTTEAFSGGHNLKGWCDNMSDRDLHWGLCVGSITAAHDTIMAYQSFDGMEQLVCIPETATRGDVVETVVKHMKDNPDDLDYSLGDLVLIALFKRYPCLP